MVTCTIGRVEVTGRTQLVTAPQTYSREQIEGWVACGPPESCVEQLQSFADVGATDILLRFPSWDQKGQFKRCVEEVLPHLV